MNKDEKRWLRLNTCLSVYRIPVYLHLTKLSAVAVILMEINKICLKLWNVKRRVVGVVAPYDERDDVR